MIEPWRIQLCRCDTNSFLQQHHSSFGFGRRAQALLEEPEKTAGGDQRIARTGSGGAVGRQSRKPLSWTANLMSASKFWSV